MSYSSLITDHSLQNRITERTSARPYRTARSGGSETIPPEAGMNRIPKAEFQKI